MPCGNSEIYDADRTRREYKLRRASISGTSSPESSMLDEFPLPDGLENYNSEPQTRLDRSPNMSSSSICQEQSASVVSSVSSKQSSPVKAPAPPRKESVASMTQTERRYLRYGHSYNSSWNEARFRLSSTNHVPSHSWDAGEAIEYR